MLSFLKSSNPPILLVGLGNPGDKYKNNRHNVGFMVMDSLIDKDSAFPAFREKFQGLLSEGNIIGNKIVLLKPMTYMNESGQSVGKCAKFYKVPPERIIVFHDELDLKPGEVRVKQGGGNAGHNGLKSIQAHLGTPDFWRVRIGIGRPQGPKENKGDVSNYVLSDFAKAEHSWLEPLLGALADNAETLITDSPKEYGEKINGI